MNMTVPRFNLRSKRFRKGFLDGFTAYYCYFQERTPSRCAAADATLSHAWREVGSALEKASNQERGKIVKTSRKSAEKTHASA